MKPIKPVLSDGKIKSILQSERSNSLGAEQSSDLSDQRIRAMEYYMGDMSKDMPAPDGESSAVSTDVQDVIEGVLPIILDALTSTNEIVEFDPVGEGDDAAAKQETAYVRHVFFQQNQGFLTMHNVVKDVLLSKNAYVKWWMEKSEDRQRECYKGLTEDALGLLLADTEVEVIDLEEYTDVDPAANQPAKYYNAVTEVRRTVRKPRIACFPPEEFLISKSAAGIRPDTSYFAHIQRKPMADAIAMFPEKEQVIRKSPAVVVSADNYEAAARQTVQDSPEHQPNADEANGDMKMIEIAEHYIRLALEADKVVRKYKITTVGTGYDIVDIEELSAWNVASGTAIIMPHRHFGRALADLAVDIQQIKTALLRATLNNAYFANNQRVEVSETHASENTIDDLLNNRVGGIVRTKMPGGLNQLPTQSIGGWTVPIIEYMDGIKEGRTGVSKANTGLDIDSMNHARTGAVSRIMDAAEMRVKLMTRIIAETIVVDMFRGLHGMLQEYQEEQSSFPINKKWVTVNPREWKTRNHMTVELPLGGIGKQQMLGFFAQMLTIQKEALQQQGGEGELVTYQNVYNTLAQMVKLGGLKSVDPYFSQPKPFDPNAPKPPDPRMVEANAKAQATQQQTQASIAADKAKAEFDMQVEQMKLVAQRQREQDDFAHKQVLDRMKFQHDTEMEVMRTKAKIALENAKAENQMQIDRNQAAQSAKQGVGDV